MNALQLTSRPADPKDARDLARLHYLSHTRSFRIFAAREWIQKRRIQDYQDFWEVFLTELSSREICWTAWKEESLVGTVTIKELRNSSPIFHPRDLRGLPLDQICCLRLMYVHPGFLRQGVGRELMGSARAHMENAGFQLGTLITHAANSRARGFYENQGWQLGEIFREQVKEFFEEPDVMRKRARYSLDLSRGTAGRSHSEPEED